MSHTVFFSWQADRPTKEGRNLIERALEAAVGHIGQDATVEEATRDLKIDRDTSGVPGTPPIVDTIFKKIDRAALFVPDLTFAGTREDGRPMPNPNVLIEYGWALKTLGHSRMVPVMNTAYGEPKPENMPFDLAHLLFPITYECPEGATDDVRKAARTELAKKLENALRTYFTSDEFKGTLPRPAAPPPFTPREPQNGLGRFRPPGQPLGTSAGPFGTGSIDVRLADGAASWLRVMPSVDPQRRWLLMDLEAAGSAQQGGNTILPFTARQSNYDFLRASDGFGCYGMRSERTTTGAVVFALDTGEVWSVDSDILDLVPNSERPRVIPNVLDAFARGLNQYSDFLSRLGVSGPHKWIAGMENLKNRALAIIPPPTGALGMPIQGSCIAESVIAEGLHSIGDTSAESLCVFRRL